MFETQDASLIDVTRDSFYRLLVESVLDYAIFLLDADGNIRTWNEGARRIKGYDSKEIIGKHYSIFFEPEAVQLNKPIRALHTARQEGRWTDEGWRVRKDGSRFWASVVLTALRDPEGEHIGYAKVTRDLTERKRAEEERTRLYELEHQARSATETALEQLRAIQSITEVALTHLRLDDLLAALLERIQDTLNVDTAVILLLEPDQENLVARAAKGLDEEVQQGIRIPLGEGFAGRVASERRPIIIDDLSAHTFVSPILREKGIRSLLGVPVLFEGRLIGVLHVGSLSSRKFPDADMQFLQIVGDRVALAIEHTRLVKAERTAREEAEFAEAKLRMQDEFLSIAAHELRSPMTTVKGSVQLLHRRLDSYTPADTDRIGAAAQLIDRQVDRLDRIVSHLLESVRIQSGNLNLDRACTDLVPMMASAVAVARANAPDFEFSVTAPEELWACIDPFRIEQIIRNLLDNAVKFNQNEVPRRIEINLDQPDATNVRFAIRDHGIGVPVELRPRLFERFFQVSTSGNRSGLGLGLYICKQIAKQHGGDIQAEFPTGGGTSFVVTLPADCPE